MIDKLLVSNNYKYNNQTFNVSNDGVHDSLVNSTYISAVDIERMILNFKVKVPANELDENYQKDFFQTTIDVEKFLKGVRGNYVINTFMGNFVKSLDFEPSFPFKKVKIERNTLQ